MPGRKLLAQPPPLPGTDTRRGGGRHPEPPEGGDKLEPAAAAAQQLGKGHHEPRCRLAWPQSGCELAALDATRTPEERLLGYECLKGSCPLLTPPAVRFAAMSR
ncbi:Hypothetical predicted protein [Podarcis lilfordi]|uniref:Uncharacterized protein n=1 Tax=Podarcis lilfordi TaxID=74358 RepID=A0AA35NYI6_9SAUR|nr:Hypothetical predicted protein [Podarcis lilfordi]